MNLKIRIHQILLWLVCAFASASFTQEDEQRGVLVQHSEKGKSHLVLEGYLVKVFTKDTNEYFGVLGIHDSKTIVVGKDHIKLSEIIEFRGNDRRRTVGGKATMLVGAGLIGAAVITFIATGEITEITPLVQGMIVAGSVGVVAVSAGAAAYADRKNYKIAKGWSFSITGGDTVKQ